MDSAAQEPMIKILHFEDNPADAILIQRGLRCEGIPCEIRWVQCRADFERACREGGFDLVLADYKLPEFDGLSAYHLFRKQYPHHPFIFVSGSIGEDLATEVIRQGVTDYVLKDQLSRLAPAVRRAVREKAAHQETERMELKDECPLGRQFVVFQLSGILCGLPLEEIREILPMAALSRPLGLPPLVDGFLNLGGTAIPVIRLARLFRLHEKPPDLYSHLLLLKRQVLALQADYVEEIISVREAECQAIEDGECLNGCTAAQISREGKTLYLLSSEKLLLEQEKARIGELRDMEQERLKELKVGT